jgi:multisubunit Na+/H+ antiporter MnhB subunit
MSDLLWAEVAWYTYWDEVFHSKFWQEEIMVSLKEILADILGLLRGILSILGVLSVGMALLGALIYRLAGLDPRKRQWGNIREMTLLGLLAGVLGLIGQVLGASVKDLLGLPLEVLLLLWGLTAIIGLFVLMLIPPRPAPAPTEAGASTRAMAEQRRKNLIKVLLVGFAILLVLLSFLVKSQALGIGGIGMFVLLLIIRMGAEFLDKIARRGERAVRRAEKGAYAEEQVGRVLERLGEDFFVIHDIESPYGNIDHLVITREGRIFLLETKSHRGKVTAAGDSILLNGHPMEKDPIEQVLRNVFWLKGRLREVVGREPWVEGIVVFSRALVPKDLIVRGVRVQNLRYLEPILRAKGQGDSYLWESRELIRQALKAEPPK